MNLTIDINKMHLRLVLKLDGNSEHVAYIWGKISLFGDKHLIHDCYHSMQMPYKDQIRKIMLLMINIWYHEVSWDAGYSTSRKASWIFYQIKMSSHDLPAIPNPYHAKHSEIITVCLRSLDPFCTVNYYLKWIKTS